MVEQALWRLILDGQWRLIFWLVVLSGRHNYLVYHSRLGQRRRKRDLSRKLHGLGVESDVAAVEIRD